jgi:Fe-S-cluster containining protein
MAKRLGLDELTFYRRHAHRVDGRWSLRERQTPEGYDCVFLDRSEAPEKVVCSIYGARPAQCRTWPFWPENLVTKDAWKTVKRRTPCPGMGNGPLVPIEKIRIQRDRTPSEI